ncbi:MAG: 16S rRNA (adenine(1518)-N(6)/adenine(1519)-N(6))-dimethyltransferase RsmA [PS1 clade bacterium]|nr:16S rRNA (adenine(1518)-N(6)/adenine(1519)-N(6))-dimethyltransferase RsmA [PS1 clade bacterium]MBL6783526.1 16S rRNA (adenine(1518)-N(6)/adenine(1519)-N(6))-dimethyltransferase RsmA [PS1 clade bacterium]
MSEDGLPPLRDIINRHDLRADKKFGQNFILDLNVTRRIARQAGDLTACDVVEVGPGPGGLTRGLLMEGTRKVHVIEADSRFMPALEEIAAAYPGRLNIIAGDALAITPESLTQAPYRIVSNLPYNIGTALLTNWLDGAWQNGIWSPRFLSMTLMFQKEVAQRITAQAGDKHYGRLAVLANWLCDTELAFDVDRQVFVPPPKVTSAIAHLTPRPQPAAEAAPDALAKLTAAAFGQRRKMLRSSLKQICSDPIAALAEAGIDETARAEVLSIEDFCKLARLLAADY